MARCSVGLCAVSLFPVLLASDLVGCDLGRWKEPAEKDEIALLQTELRHASLKSESRSRASADKEHKEKEEDKASKEEAKQKLGEKKEQNEKEAKELAETEQQQQQNKNKEGINSAGSSSKIAADGKPTKKWQSDQEARVRQDDAGEDMQEETEQKSHGKKDGMIPLDPRSAWAAYNDQPQSLDPLENKTKLDRSNNGDLKVGQLPMNKKKGLDHSRERSERKLSVILLALGVSGFMAAVLIAIVTDLHARQQVRQAAESPAEDATPKCPTVSEDADAAKGSEDKKVSTANPLLQNANGRRTTRGG
eukprot:gnl/TRDRNA2_/TRDRNA2_187727_c0_seq1.p1 gnl/TRDRNA2_/TRDRNA2_187727_c0~~gnl/TRDRNA2_/TRDRNA2_187727_c0_seq1.p1  ORF type:complete len:306 (-),score=100.76 gnl/TRDRNA2_/TRDRNA2_187727_c0_seq1:103-1020(-)